MEFDTSRATAVAGRSHSVGFQIVQKTLNLSDVNLLGGLRATNHFWWVYLGRLGTSIGLVSCAV